MVVVVSHDAGGAHLLSSWVRRHPQYTYAFILDGPAIKIFESKMTSLKNYPLTSIDDCLEAAEFVMTTISWNSNIENIAILKSRERGVRVVTLLDHWVNYPRRFELDGRMTLPDEIWVGDEDALKIARRYFPSDKLRLVQNFYFEDICDQLNNLNIPRHPAGKTRILYVCDPITDFCLGQFGNRLHWGYTEFDALRLFLQKLPLLCALEQLDIVRLRYHPSEPEGKYRHIVNEFPQLPIEESSNASLIEDWQWSDWIVGCESMALVVGLLARKRVISCIPKGGKACALPHKNIEKIN